MMMKASAVTTDNHHVSQMATKVNVQPVNCSYLSNTFVRHVFKVELNGAAACQTRFLHEVVFCSVGPFSFLFGVNRCYVNSLLPKYPAVLNDLRSPQESFCSLVCL